MSEAESVGAGGEEGDVAKVEKPGEADHDVEPEAEDDVKTDEEKDTQPGVGEEGDDGDKKDGGKEEDGEE